MPSLMEPVGGFGMSCEIGEKRLSVEKFESRLPCPDCLKHFAPRPVDLAPGKHRDFPGDRVRMLGPKVLAHLAQCEMSMFILFEYRSEEHTSELQSLRHLVCRL